MKFIRWLADFFEDAGPSGGSSMTRLCALIFALTASVAVFRGTEAGIIVALVAGGTVALLTRGRAE